MSIVMLQLVSQFGEKDFILYSYTIPTQPIFARNSETNVPYQTRFHHKITGFDFQGQGYIHTYLLYPYLSETPL